MPLVSCLPSLLARACGRIGEVFVLCRARLMDAFVLYLARPIGQCDPAIAAHTQALFAELRHGDVVLSEGNTRAAALVRRITKSPWAHVSMYVGPLEEGPDPRCIVEADVAEGVRAVPLSALSGQRVRVLRPAGLRDADLRRLADWIVSRIGHGYDVAHAWALARRFLRQRFATRLQPPRETMAQGATRFICSSLLAQAFVLVGCPIVPAQIGIRGNPLAPHRYVTPQDFESAAVFQVVRNW